jgi:hypothetical protein
MSNKLDINVEMQALDEKNRLFYDSLSDEERKKFSTYLIFKWGANVEGSADFQEWYLRATNERVNKNFFDLGKHPKLQWLLCTTVSPGMGKRRHYWLKASRNVSNTEFDKKVKFILTQKPQLSTEEVELMAKLNTIEELRIWALNLGWDDKKINSEL